MALKGNLRNYALVSEPRTLDTTYGVERQNTVAAMQQKDGRVVLGKRLECVSVH